MQTVRRKTKVYIATECPYAGILSAVIETSKVLYGMGFEIYYILPSQPRDRYGENQIEHEKLLSQYGGIIHLPLRKKYWTILSDTMHFKKMFQKNHNDIFISFANYAGKIYRLLYMMGIIKNVYHSPNCLETKRFEGKIKFIEYCREKFLAPYTKHYLACGPSEAYLLAHTFNVTTHKILLSPNFRTTSQISKTSIDHEFVYIGRMVKNKGIQLLLQTLSILGLLHKAIFIGDGYDLKELKDNYPNANFIGRVPRNEISQYVSKSKFIISASVMEGLPYSIIEGMMGGTVPILSNVEGHKDIVIDGYNGFLYNDPLELTNILLKSQLIPESHYEQLSQNCQESIELLNQLGKNRMIESFNIFS